MSGLEKLPNGSVKIIPAPVYSVEDGAVIDGLRFSESIRNLDERTAMKIALALAGTHPVLFRQISEVTKTQNLVPSSTLKLNPPPAVVDDPKAHQKALDYHVETIIGDQ